MQTLWSYWSKAASISWALYWKKGDRFLYHFPDEILDLMNHFKKLAGVGQKTAERFAFSLLDWREAELQSMAKALRELKQKLRYCKDCGAMTSSQKEEPLCSICEDPRRDRSLICVVAYPRDVYQVEETREYKGLYHVLGGLLSPILACNEEDLNISQLRRRLESRPSEVIIALDSTLEGDTTALFLKQELAKENHNVSRLAFGIPMGSSLDYVDGGTLARSLLARSSF